jgi:hypothetical protein
MFARETVADDPRRVLSQRIWIIERDKQNQIVQKVYGFREPQRWVHAGDDPLLMQSLLPDDISQLVGCELNWVKTNTGFRGGGDRASLSARLLLGRAADRDQRRTARRRAADDATAGGCRRPFAG